METEMIISWVILGTFLSFVGVPGFIAFFGMDDTYWRMWLAGHMLIGIVVVISAAVYAVYWALFTVLFGA